MGESPSIAFIGAVNAILELKDSWQRILSTVRMVSSPCTPSH